MIMFGFKKEYRKKDTIELVRPPQDSSIPDEIRSKS